MVENKENRKSSNDENNKVQLRVSKGKCMMCGLCVSMYPNYFDFSDDNSQIDDSQAQVGQDEVDDIIDACPQAAIYKEE